MEGRKTVTSSEVKQRYNKKTYLNIGLQIRRDKYPELIKKIELLRENGEKGAVTRRMIEILNDNIEKFA